MGVIRSTTNFAQSILQTFWGRLSDKMGRRVPLIFLGSLIASSIWIAVAFARSVYEYLGLIIVQTLAVSVVIPTWTALIGDNTTPSNRATVVAHIQMWYVAGVLAANLASGMLASIYGGPGREAYTLPLIISGVLGVAGSFLILGVSEKPKPYGRTGKPILSKSILLDLRRVKHNRVFYEFCKVNFIASFCTSLAWPIFPVTLQAILEATPVLLTILSVVQGLVRLIVQRYADRVIDRVGCKDVIVLFRSFIVLVPTIYLASEVLGKPSLVVASSLVTGVIMALGTTAYTVYILDAVPEFERGEMAAAYNLFEGIATTLGSLAGGTVANLLESYVGLIWATRIVYLISIAGRIFSAILVAKIVEDVREPPSSLKKELLRLVSAMRDKVKALLRI